MFQHREAVYIKNRKIYLDVLRFIAIIAVVSIHVSTNLVFNKSLFGGNTWWLANIIDSSSRWSVAVFIMISGALLLGTDKNESKLEFFKKRFSKVVIPFIFWSFAYYIYTIRYNFYDFSFIKFLIIFITNGTVYHFWYVYMIIGLYLIIPILNTYIKGATNKDIEYFLILWAIGTTTYPLISKFFNLNIGFVIPLVSNYVGYLVLGYFFDTIVDVRKKFRLILYILGCCSLIFTIYWSYIYSTKELITDSFHDILLFNNTLMAIAIFIFIKTIFNRYSIKSNSIKKFIISVSNASYGMYLIHVMVMDQLLLGILGIKMLDNQFMNPSIGMILTIGLTSLLSYIIVSLLKKIKYIRNIV